MNKATPSHLIAHYINLALLPRNHGYEPTTIPIGERLVTVLRHAEGKEIAAVAVCGELQLRTDGSVWGVWRGEEQVAEERIPAMAMDRYWDELGRVEVMSMGEYQTPPKDGVW